MRYTRIIPTLVATVAGIAVTGASCKEQQPSVVPAVNPEATASFVVPTEALGTPPTEASGTPPTEVADIPNVELPPATIQATETLEAQATATIQATETPEAQEATETSEAQEATETSEAQEATETPEAQEATETPGTQATPEQSVQRGTITIHGKEYQTTFQQIRLDNAYKQMTILLPNGKQIILPWDAYSLLTDNYNNLEGKGYDNTPIKKPNQIFDLPNLVLGTVIETKDEQGNRVLTLYTNDGVYLAENSEGTIVAKTGEEGEEIYNHGEKVVGYVVLPPRTDDNSNYDIFENPDWLNDNFPE